jgi:general secretion pathway protein H
MASRAVRALMLKLVIGMQNKPHTAYGFTLIEILVVVLIVGITMGFALLAFGDFGSSKRIMMAAEQFVNYVKFVQQEAILETSTLGVRIQQNNYEALRFQPPANWQSMPKTNVFRQQHFPTNATLQLEGSLHKTGSPQIIINSSGDITPFRLNIGSENKANIVMVVGSSNGSVNIQVPPSP